VIPILLRYIYLVLALLMAAKARWTQNPGPPSKTSQLFSVSRQTLTQTNENLSIFFSEILLTDRKSVRDKDEKF